MDRSEFNKQRHEYFLQMMLNSLPAEYETQEINSLTLAHFALSGLAILDSLHLVDKDQIVNWVLSLQSHRIENSEFSDGQFYGFYGSKSSEYSNAGSNKVSWHNCSHLASTYCALAILKIVGFDFEKIDAELISKSMNNLQQSDGSFMPTHIGAETDLRFVYCAAAICYMLNNWSGMDKESTKEYIRQCQSYDGGFGLVPGSESHVWQAIHDKSRESADMMGHCLLPDPI